MKTKYKIAPSNAVVRVDWPVYALIFKLCLFVLLLYIPVKRYGDGWMVSSPNHTFPGQA